MDSDKSNSPSNDSPPTVGFERVLLGPQDSIRQSIEIIEAGSIQIALVADPDRKLLGTVTDGDIRRGLLRGIAMNDTVDQVMNRHPLSALVGTPASEILRMMTTRSVKQIPLVDASQRIIGLELLDNLLRGPEVKDNPVLILAGGLGARLHPLTAETPKPLLKVGGQPVLELIVNQVRASGFRRLFISVNHLAERIEEYFGDGSRHGMNITYLRESAPLGTAGPLGMMPKSSKFPFIAVNGDLLTKVNFERMVEFHNEGGFDLTIGIKEYPFQVPFGVVEIEEDRVLGFREKPVETRAINAGVYVGQPEILNLVPDHTRYDMNQLIEHLLSQSDKTIGAFLIHEYWADIGTVADYQQAQSDYPAYFGGQV